MTHKEYNDMIDRLQAKIKFLCNENSRLSNENDELLDENARLGDKIAHFKFLKNDET